MTPIASVITRTLDDELMALLALLTVFAVGVPFVYELTPALSRAFFFWDFFVVGLFALEYGAGLVLAANKTEFLHNRWRLLDAFIIIATLASLLPLPTDALAASPALRLIRFVRLAVLGTRSSARVFCWSARSRTSRCWCAIAVISWRDWNVIFRKAMQKRPFL